MASGPAPPDAVLTDPGALRAQIDAGLTLDQIAAMEGCSVSTVRRAARRLGLPPGKPGRKPTPPLVDHDTLATLIASGMTTAQIAAHVGRSTNVVRSWINRHGLTFPQHPRRRPDPPQLRDVEWLRREHHDRGRSLTNIAREIGRPHALVGRRFREYGIQIRQQRTYPQLRDALWLEKQFAAGKSARTIAVDVGCSEAAVRLASIAAGVVPRARRT